MFYYPNGNQCVNCKKLYDNCSKLPFSKFKPILKDEDGVMVICFSYKKK